MAWHEEISDGLPTPRDDEPANLRQDIVDELSDHLHCALNRELHHGNDEKKAKQNAIELFGNPARIAYRLWFDAMKEKIMSQRITLAAAIVFAVACLFVAGMAWQMSQQSRETNIALLDKMSAMAMQQEQHPSLDWNPVKLKFVTGDENGPPAAGFKVSLSGGGGFGSGVAAANPMPQIDEVSGEDGAVDFGLVRYGVYQLMITSPWQERGNDSITVRPGKVFSKTIVCPSKPEPADLALEIDWPDDLKQEKLWACASVYFESVYTHDPKLFWQSFGVSGQSSRYVLIGDTGANVDCGALSPFPKHELPAGIGQPIRQLKPEPSVHGPARHAFLTELQILVQPQTTPDGKLELPNFPLATYGFKPLGSAAGPRPYGGGGYGGGGVANFGLAVPDTSVANADSTATSAEVPQYPSFEPKPNQLNHWKIKLPSELVDFVRKQRAAKK